MRLAMSVEQAKAFWEAVKSDTGLQEKIKASTDGVIDTQPEVFAIVAIAKEAGFDITPADLWRNKLLYCMELRDEDLAKVANGWILWDVATGHFTELPNPELL